MDEIERMLKEKPVRFPTSNTVKISDDMNTGKLILNLQDDGDIGLSVYDNEDKCFASVEFCTSGGKCPNVLNALRALMCAIEDDNKNLPEYRRVS